MIFKLKIVNLIKKHLKNIFELEYFINQVINISFVCI